LKDEHETHLSTEQSASQTDARLSGADEHSRRAAGSQAPPGQGPQAPDGFHPAQAGTLSSAAGQRSQRFPAQYRLRKRREFLALQREGRRATGTHFVVITRPTHHPPSRLGITTSRKVGNAPTRNRIRRLVREFFRRHRVALIPPRDVLVIARPGSATLRYRNVDDELTRVLRLAPPAE
jgi:ribonuclease P protein component